MIRLKEPLPPKRTYVLAIRFSGAIWDTAVGMFRGQYAGVGGEKHTYVATHMRPNNARRLFPCFDEPQFKTPFNVSIARPRTHHTLFNTELNRTIDAIPTPPSDASAGSTAARYVLDQFEITEPMATFEFGFVVSSLTEVADASAETADLPTIRIWARPEFHGELETLRERIIQILNVVRRYLNVAYPLPKLDVVALPGFSALKPIDNWGLLVFK